MFVWHHIGKQSRCCSFIHKSADARLLTMQDNDENEQENDNEHEHEHGNEGQYDASPPPLLVPEVRSCTPSSFPLPLLCTALVGLLVMLRSSLCCPVSHLPRRRGWLHSMWRQRATLCTAQPIMPMPDARHLSLGCRWSRSSSARSQVSGPACCDVRVCVRAQIAGVQPPLMRSSQPTPASITALPHRCTLCGTWPTRTSVSCSRHADRPTDVLQVEAHLRHAAHRRLRACKA